MSFGTPFVAFAVVIVWLERKQTSVHATTKTALKLIGYDNPT